MVYMYHSFLSHSSADGHLGCFHVLAIINSAAMMRQVLGPGALGRPRGIGWRWRWEEGLGWGIHVNPWLIHVNVWQKPLQYCKVISLQLIKKKKANSYPWFSRSWIIWSLCDLFYFISNQIFPHLVTSIYTGYSLNMPNMVHLQAFILAVLFV